MSEDFNDNQENLNEGDELDNILTLNDENGNAVDFELNKVIFLIFTEGILYC